MTAADTSENVGCSTVSMEAASVGDAAEMAAMMREPPPTTPGCSSAQWPGAQLCHTSCFREMARGDVQPLYFERNATGHVVKLRVPGSFIECGRVG